MSFQSIEYLVFLIVLTLIYYSVNGEYKWIVLLAGSIFFIFSHLQLSFLFVLVMILIDYYLAKVLISSRRKPIIFYSGISLNILFLLFYRISFSFGQNNMNSFLIMPIGLSFVIFTMLSYLIDVKRGNLNPESNIAKLSLYFLYFPKLVQGPIERGNKFLSQITTDKKFDYNLFSNGLKYIIIGFIKKLVIADRIAIFTGNVFDNVYHFHGIELIIATLLFSFQIYTDFSGYTDIAIGSAQLFGYKLSDNFNKPYSSKNISEFWKKWHITLSNWLRDYIFLPISYSLTRKIKMKRILFFTTDVAKDYFVYILSTIITFVVCGIWHGIGINFLIWGLNFALFLSFSRITKKIRSKLISYKTRKLLIVKISSMIFTFLLVSFNWIFFRTNNFGEALYVIKSSFLGIIEFINNISNFGYVKELYIASGLKGQGLKIIFLGIFVLIITEIVSKEKNFVDYLSNLPIIPRWIIYYFFMFIVIFYSIFNKT
ncbi:MAG: hypothetical protein L7F78_04745, partial [Syntrophales bacterium LBB04]|nr:hypothetical protein [Syntrophales bacterium LBB04]